MRLVNVDSCVNLLVVTSNNPLLTKNLTLKVGKARYGEPFADTKNFKEERDLLAVENQNLKEKIKVLLEKEQSNSPSLLSKIDHAFQFLQEGSFFEPLIEPLITNFNLVRHPFL